MKPRRTDHQKEIMGLVLKAAGEGAFILQKDLPGLLSYAGSVTYGAIRVSVRFLEEQGMLVREPVGRDRKLVPTMKGYDWFRPAR